MCFDLTCFQEIICRDAVAKFGYEKQIKHVAEELRELADALEGGVWEEMVDERADVAIMLHQLDNLLQQHPWKDDVDRQIPKKIAKLKKHIAAEPYAEPTRIKAADPYQSLADVLDGALQQASGGKGAERHGNGKPFEDQPILQITRLLNDHPVAALAFQVVKKTVEAGRLFKLKGVDAAVNELHGAINYAAAAVLRFKEMGGV